MGLVTRRFDIFLVELPAAAGSSNGRMRPCLVISPDEMNRHLPTVIVAPLTTRALDLPTRVPVTFKFKNGQVALEQLRAVDKRRLSRHLGRLGGGGRERVLAALSEMFAE